jgi:Zn-dependent protease
VLLHEVGHGLTARRLGVPVTEYVITLWGGHTQFDREMRGPGASALVSVAGPAINGVLALACLWATGRTTGLPAFLLSAGAIANGFVAAFNLLPGLPLDGGRVLEALVWRLTGDRTTGTRVAGMAGRVLAVGVAVVTLGWPLLLGGRPDLMTAILVLLVSGFLWAGASQAIRSAALARQAGGVDLLALARPAVVVRADATLADVDAAVRPGAATVLAAEDGRPVGLVDDGVAATVPAALRGRTQAQAVATAVAPVSVISEQRGLPAVRAMSRAQGAGPTAVLVDPGTSPPRVIGVVRVESVIQALGRPVGRGRSARA